MMPEPRHYSPPIRARWSKTFVPVHELERDALVELTNERRDHHLAHAEPGDTVTVLGTIKYVAFPPSTAAQRDANARRAVFTLDDGTGMVEFEASADNGLQLLGATVEVSGTIRSRTRTLSRMDASLVEVLFGGRADRDDD